MINLIYSNRSFKEIKSFSRTWDQKIFRKVNTNRSSTVFIVEGNGETQESMRLNPITIKKNWKNL